MTAVAVWDHHPTARELLEHRLAQGWVPTATALKTGEEVLGYAACVFGDRRHAPGEHPRHPPTSSG